VEGPSHPSSGWITLFFFSSRLTSLVTRPDSLVASKMTMMKCLSPCRSMMNKILFQICYQLKRVASNQEEEDMQNVGNSKSATQSRNSAILYHFSDALPCYMKALSMLKESWNNATQQIVNELNRFFCRRLPLLLPRNISSISRIGVKSVRSNSSMVSSREFGRELMRQTRKLSSIPMA
jgi:hypothetical protein